IGNYCTVSPDASVGPYSVLGAGTTLRERARVSRTVIDASTYVGRGAVIEGAVLGRNCDVKSHARVHEGVAIGDQVTLGDQSVIFPGVRIYPYKEVEYGAQIHESLIWESRGTTRVFAQDGVVGLVNVDLTPEIALRFGAALGTALKRGARVVASRESAPAYRMIKRALISGLHSTGVHVADLRTLPAPVGKHLLKTQGYDAIKARGVRIVVDDGSSGGGYVLPLVLGPRGVESISAHAFESDTGSTPARLAETIDQAQRLVAAVNADFGAVCDRSAERLYLIDERGREVRPDQALLLYLKLLGGDGGKVVVPITATSQVEEVVGGRFEV